MGRGMTKAERLTELKRRYIQRAYSDRELADILGTRRETIYRDRKELETEYPFIQDERGRWKIDRTKFISEIKVSPHEALTLYLAARKASRQMHYRNPHVANAVEKLAAVLHQPMAGKLLKAADAVLHQGDAPQKVKILETLSQGWMEQRKVRIRYRPLRYDGVSNHVIHPYLIEPSIWSDSLYVIAYSEVRERIISFKVERVDTAFLSGETFEIPPDFDEQELLKHAWGIWHGERPPQTVRLRFDKSVVQRVRESKWHPLENVTGMEDGGCIWEAPIAEWREMLPWIRGWGVSVEVLEPEELRDTLKNTAQALALKYRVEGGTQRLPLYLPYAKTNPANRDGIHLLLYHLIDVGQVAIVIWNDVLTTSIRHHLAEMLQMDIDSCGRFLAFLAALHDLGKASPAYQKKYAPDWLKTTLAENGLALGTVSDGRAYDTNTPHGVITTWVLQNLLPEMLGLDQRFARKIATAVGGHHGVWPSPRDTKRLRDSAAWDAVRRDLFLQLQGVFSSPVAVTPPETTAALNTFLTILSGLTSIADWVGSRNKERFGFKSEVIAPRQYAQQSREKAYAELKSLGWIAWQPDGVVKDFAATFAYLGFEKPREFQQMAINTASEIQEPTLLIIEAPTGSGKTEAALYIADVWLQRNRGRGLYVAMPTQATSNQMFRRVKTYLKERYPEDLVNIHLVHGQAGWSDAMMEITLQRVGDSTKDRVAAMTWFKPRKRTLLAPFGVGTVDQTLMSILQTRHFFVRLFGLAHKVIIFDEVHAYDTYMNTLFRRLLTWLNALGTSVIILSATLPSETRQALVEAYTRKRLDKNASIYPALILANANQQQVVQLPEPEKYPLQIDWSVGRGSDDILRFLQRELAQGGCAAVICNTVRRAQEIYRVVRDADIVPDDDLILFHSRFPPVWRKGIEEKVLRKFGKGGERPHKAIVIATQVIEQSLDIDFDLMITDLAPIDLLLQRAGRLHRHENNERYGLPRRLVVVEPEKDDNGLPHFGSDKFYGEYILLRSYLVLRNKTVISIPDDTVALIESVYSDSSDLPFPNERWEITDRRYREKIRGRKREREREAGKYLVLGPDKGRYLEANAGLEEDDPTMHKAFRARTRDIDLSLTVVCLHKVNGHMGGYNENNAFVPIDLNGEVSTDQVKLLLQNALSIQHKGIVFSLLDEKIPDAWTRDASLRYCRYLVFTDGVNEAIPGYTLTLNSELGLSIIKQEDQ